MKRILRFASVIALSGAALLYTGCAKDYSGDLSELQEEQAKQGTTLATHTDQIKALQEADANLQKQLTTLTTTVNDLKAAEEKAVAELKAADQANTELINALTKRVEVLESARSSMEQDIATVKATIDAIKSTISGNTSDIAALKQQLAEHLSNYGILSGKVETYAQIISTVQNKVESLQSKVQDNYNTLIDKINDLSKQYDALATQMTTVLGDISWLKSNFDNYYTIGQVDGIVETINKSIKSVETAAAEALAAKASELEQKGEALKSKVETMETSVNAAIAALQTKDTELEQKIVTEVNTLQGEIDVINTSINSIKDDIVTIQDNIKDIVIDIEKINKAIDALKAQDEVLKGLIDGVSDDLDAAKKALEATDAKLESEISALEDRVEVLEAAKIALEKQDQAILAEIEKIKADITELQKGVAANASQITQLWTNVNSLMKDLGTLESTVTTNKSLFDAYCVTTDSRLAALEQFAKNTRDSLKTAFGRIDWCEKNFENYYKKGEVDGLCEALGLRITNVNTDLQAKYAELVQNDTTLSQAIRENAKNIADEIAARKAADQELKTELDAKITANQKNISTLTETTIPGLQAQIDVILARVAANEKAIEALEAAVEGLKNADKSLSARIKADSLALIAAKNALQEEINKAKQDLQSDIDLNSDKIAALQDTVANHLASLNTLKAASAELKSTIELLKTDISTNKAAIDENTANISKLYNACDSLGTVLGSVQTQVDSLDKAVSDTLKDVKSRLDVAFAKIQKNLDDAVASIQTKLDEANGKIQTNATDIQTNKDEIAKLWDVIGSSYETGLLGKITDVANRVTSISVRPTTHYELINLKVGDKNSNIFVSSFQIEPKKKAQVIANEFAAGKECVSIDFKEAMTRVTTTVPAKQPVVTVVSADDNGVLTVVVKNAPAFPTEDNSLYFALTYNGNDEGDGAAYSLTSDYAAAKFYKEAIDWSSKFYTGKDDKSIISADTIVCKDSNDYKYYVSKEYKPFVGCGNVNFRYEQPKDTKFAGFFDPIFGADKSIMSSAKFAELTGVELNLTYKIANENDTRKYFPWVTDEKTGKFVPEESATLVDTTITFKHPADTLQKYVGYWDLTKDDKLGGFKMNSLVNGYQVPYSWLASFNITRVKHTAKKIELNMFWNYKHFTYKARDARINSDSLKIYLPEDTPNQMTWTELFESTDTTWASFNDDQPVYEIGVQTYINKDFVAIYGRGDLNKAKKDSLGSKHVRYNDTDEYTFPVDYHVDSTFTKFVTTAKDSVAGSISKATNVTIYGYSTTFAKTNYETLVHGLSDEEAGKLYEDVEKELSDAQYSDYKFYLDGKDITSEVTPSLVNGDLKLSINPGLIAYTQKKELVVETALYGVTYITNVTIKTGMPKFHIEYNDLYVTDGKAVVRGKYDNGTYGTYGINDMFYNHFWKICGSFEDEDLDNAKIMIGFAGTGDYKEADKWGSTENHGKIGYEEYVVLDHNSNDSCYFFNNSVMTWGDYQATSFTLNPRIYINYKDATVEDVTVRKPVEFTTPYPVRFNTAFVPSLSATRKAGEAITFYLWRGVQVDGYYDNGQGGDWKNELVDHSKDVTSNDDIFKAAKYQYDSLALQYIVPETITTTAGDLLVKGLDYEYDESDAGVFEFKKESGISHDFVFTIDVKLVSRYDHCRLESIVPVKTVTITIKQQ